MNIDQMPAGRELDALVAEKVMGWTQVHRVDSTGDLCGVPSRGAPPSYLLPRYSTDIAAAWKVIEKLRQLQFTVRLVAPNEQYGNSQQFSTVNSESRWTSFQADSLHFREVPYEKRKEVLFETRASSAPLAICRAALKVMADRRSSDATERE